MADENLSYKDAGVDIDAGERAVELFKLAVKSTMRPEVLEGIGGFSGAVEIKGYKAPVLVSGADGVGTKLKIAFMMDVHDTVGIDLVAMCANDVATSGADCLFFLDYMGTGKLDPDKAADVVRGIASGCRHAGCALIGGETAEMPGFYAPGEYDLAGFCVGVVERELMLKPASVIRPGDLLLGWPSSGHHSNGYSLTRKIFFDKLGWGVDKYVPELGRNLGEELLEPTRIYARECRELAQTGLVKGFAHITGGGVENIPRLFPKGCKALIDTKSWTVPPIFQLIQKLGNIERGEMYRTYNMGLGMALAVDPKRADSVAGKSGELGLGARVIGKIVEGAGGVELDFGD